MRVNLQVFQSTANFNPAAASRFLDTEEEARFALNDTGVLPFAVAARMLPHLVERFRGLAGGAFLDDGRARNILRSATDQLEARERQYSAFSVGEAVQVFGCFDPQRIQALRPVGPVPAPEQQRLDEILSEACQSNHPQSIRALAAAGARLQVNAQGDTLAHAAARAGREWLMPALLEGGMPSADVMRPNRMGRTPADVAVRAGHLPVIRSLRAAGVGLGTLMAPDAQGFTLAHRAAADGRPPVIAALNEAVGPVALMAPDAEGRTPAHHAASTGRPEGIAALRAAGVGVDALMAADSTSVTPIHLAAQQGAVRVIRKFQLVGVNAATLMTPTTDGYTPAHFAAANGNPEVITTLREAVVLPDMLMKPDADGNTPAHTAAIHKHPEVIRQLQAAGVGSKAMRAPNRNGFTPVDCAEGHRGVIAALREAGVPQYEVIASRIGAAVSGRSRGAAARTDGVAL